MKAVRFLLVDRFCHIDNSHQLSTRSRLSLLSLFVQLESTLKTEKTRCARASQQARKNTTVTILSDRKAYYQ
ncbi:hypothetical protein J2Z48_002180 [Croceifilum oryzae]|uniref:Uncharacterized protein n=1 Tax=Croceifilum oryzae TaxID=1553429 RepID=A0AAJ1TL50_9BACL|nr:hypothetical protein [Croceifilum oryzae]MDQ0417996.1 hypothetical protein [Croceifilum oryzae]